MITMYLLGLSLLALVAYMMGRVDGVKAGRRLGFRAGARAQHDKLMAELQALADEKRAAEQQ